MKLGTGSMGRFSRQPDVLGRIVGVGGVSVVVIVSSKSAFHEVHLHDVNSRV